MTVNLEGGPVCEFTYTKRWPDFVDRLAEAVGVAVGVAFETEDSRRREQVRARLHEELAYRLDGSFVTMLELRDVELEEHLALRPCCECDDGGY